MVSLNTVQMLNREDQHAVLTTEPNAGILRTDLVGVLDWKANQLFCLGNFGGSVERSLIESNVLLQF
jgi:hypothetical protein